MTAISETGAPKRSKLPGLVLIVVATGLVIWTLWFRAPSPANTGAKVLEAPRKSRSIVVVTMDTIRTDRLEPYGATNVATPVLQRLADEGLTFDHALSVAPITLVAHTSILSGLYPPRHGVRNNGTHYVPSEIDTLGEILAGEGYRTGAFVSAAVLEDRYGLGQGFEVYDDDLSTGRERHPRMVPDRPAEATVDAARAWLDSIGDDEKYFLWVHFYDPHAAYSPPPPFRDTYRDRLYDGEIAYMDSQLGRLLEHPRIEREKDHALFVLGDHGESLGEHGEQTHAILAYDSTLHIPWIARVSDGPVGKRSPVSVSQVDLMPTVLDLVGLEPPGEVDGTSLLELNIPGASTRARALYGETFLPHYTYGWAKLKTLHKGRWKFIDGPGPELFDLQRDPKELSNLHESQPGTAHDMKRDLEELLDRYPDAEQEASLSLDTESLEKLRSLGYVAVGSGSASSERELLNPRDVIGLHVGLEKGRQFALDRLYEAAIQQVRAVLSQDPNNLAALTDLAGYLEQDGQVDEAVEALEKALSLDPDYSRFYVQLAGLEARRGAPEKALDLLDHALEIDPRFLEAKIQRAQILGGMGRTDEASAMLRALLEEYPDHPNVLLAHARGVDLAEGNPDAAAQHLRAALDADPFFVPGWRQLAGVYELLGQLQDAEAAYRSGLERAPDDADLHARLGFLLARTSSEEAEMHLREALRLADGFRDDVHVALGGWLAEHGRISEAEDQYARVLAEEPDHGPARNNRAIAFYRAGRRAEAIQELKALVEEFPAYADAHNNLSAVAVEMGDWPLAEKHARKALALNPAASPTYNNLGLALENTGRLDEALVAYEKALEIEPLYFQARFNLGILLEELGRFDDAAEAFRAVLQQVPQYADAHFQLGQVLATHLDDAENARKHLNAFLRLAPPRHPAVAEAHRLLEGFSSQQP